MEKKLIRGVIYDNQDLYEENVNATLMNLNYLVSDGMQVVEEEFMPMFESPECPTKEEFLTSVIIDLIHRPAPDKENLIIPSDMIDNRLYKDLKKIDIGDVLQEEFIKGRIDEFDRKTENQILPEEGKIIHFHFDSKEDLVNGLVNLTTNGVITPEVLEEAIKQIELAS